MWVSLICSFWVPAGPNYSMAEVVRATFRQVFTRMGSFATGAQYRMGTSLLSAIWLQELRRLLRPILFGVTQTCLRVPQYILPPTLEVRNCQPITHRSSFPWISRLARCLSPLAELRPTCCLS